MRYKLDHITLMVSSLSGSVPYYEHLLPLIGFARMKDHVWTDGNGFHLQFMQARHGTSPYERYAAGMNHMGFRAPNPELVHEIRASMQAAGFDVPDVQDLGGAVALFMKDPDGIRCEITYYPPGMVSDSSTDNHPEETGDD